MCRELFPAFRIQDGLQLQSELLCNYNTEAASCQGYRFRFFVRWIPLLFSV